MVCIKYRVSPTCQFQFEGRADKSIAMLVEVNKQFKSNVQDTLDGFAHIDENGHTVFHRSRQIRNAVQSTTWPTGLQITPRATRECSQSKMHRNSMRNGTASSGGMLLKETPSLLQLQPIRQGSYLACLRHPRCQYRIGIGTRHRSP